MQSFLKFTSPLLIFFFFIIQGVNGQQIEGNYSDGTVSMYLEEVEGGIAGTFYDANEDEYEVLLVIEGGDIYGTVGTDAAIIIFEDGILNLYLMPMDAQGNINEDEAILFALQPFWDEDEEIASFDPDQVYWMPIKKFGEDLFPSYVLATSTWAQEVAIPVDNEQTIPYFGDGNGYFGIVVENIPVDSDITIEVEGDPLIKLSSYTIRNNTEGPSEIFPIIEYDYEVLKSIREPRSVNFKFRLFVDDIFIGEKLEVVWVRSINDAIMFAQDRFGRMYQMDFIFAAYVNENHQDIDPVLGKTLDLGIINSWTGYQGDEESIFKQVFALWYYLQKEGFKYSDISTSGGIDESIASQHVRFIGDALKAKQANCIDGTVLLASLMYKIGFDVSIILVPGHAYLGFSLDEKGERKMALETTMLGNLNLKPASGQALLVNQMQNPQSEIQQSWESFLGAVNAATQSYIDVAIPAIQQGNPEYLELNIKQARTQKIRPIK